MEVENGMGMYDVKKRPKRQLIASILRLIIAELSYLSFKGDVGQFLEESIVEVFRTSGCTHQTVKQVIAEVFSLGE